MGVEAMGLRLARRPATVREDAGGLRIGGRARAASGGAGESDIAVDDEGEGKTQAMRRKEILIRNWAMTSSIRPVYLPRQVPDTILYSCVRQHAVALTLTQGKLRRLRLCG